MRKHNNGRSGVNAVTTEVYNGVWDAIINNQANIAIGAPDTLLDGGGIDYTEIGAIRWAFAIAPDHPLAFVPEPIAESQLRLYPNIMVEDTAHTINKKTLTNVNVTATLSA